MCLRCIPRMFHAVSALPQGKGKLGTAITAPVGLLRPVSFQKVVEIQTTQAAQGCLGTGCQSMPPHAHLMHATSCSPTTHPKSLLLPAFFPPQNTCSSLCLLVVDDRASEKHMIYGHHNSPTIQIT